MLLSPLTFPTSNIEHGHDSRTGTRTHNGPAILSYGFRPFFLLGAVWAALVVAVWLPILGGWLTLPTALSPLEWHVHELTYGYVPAIVAGFLLTAVPNWTGRLPVTGKPLLALVSVWAAGRLAVLFSARIGAPIAAAIDLLFLACLAGVIAREIIAGRNPGNLKVLVLIGLLLIGNAVFHAEASLMNGGSGYGGSDLGMMTSMASVCDPFDVAKWITSPRPSSTLTVPVPSPRSCQSSPTSSGRRSAAGTQRSPSWRGRIVNGLCKTICKTAAPFSAK